LLLSSYATCADVATSTASSSCSDFFGASEATSLEGRNRGRPARTPRGNSPLPRGR
jgi:hypothetical protein